MKNPRLLAVVVLILEAASLVGQTGREAYRQAYDTWQQALGNLEREAGTGGVALVPRVDHAAAAAASFEATRAAYQKSAAQDTLQRRQLLQTAATAPSPDFPPPAVAELVAGELQTVTKTIARFATDRDRGIQQLRLSLERERVALSALNDSIQARQKTVAATSETASALEQAREKTAQAFADQASQLTNAVAQIEREGAAWADYYDKLAQTIQIASVVPARLNSAPARPPADSAAPIAPVPVAPAVPPVSSVPVTRYVGTWTYPTVNGIFHGAQPQFVDLVVHEENGHADGTLFGRFGSPPGSTTDPLVRFDFKGDFGANANQRFPLLTSDGVRGTIELIPGPAVNLLEVNFQTDPQANKIRSGNFILMKK